MPISPEPAWVLALNAGSSSLKFAVFAGSDRILSGATERIGVAHAALDGVLEQLDSAGALTRLKAIGHRVVHGGAHHVTPCLVTREIVSDLKKLTALDPDHLPSEIAVIEAVGRRVPGLPQIACFDTAFHRTIPRVARLLAIPRRYEKTGVRRYGFHGLSYTFLMHELERKSAADGRIVLAHLGSGASLAAVSDGRCVDTTMGFTPASGIIMGTRSGDLDPGVILHLIRSEHLSVEELDDLLNRRSGLLGVSETSADMRDLLARETSDETAAETVELFCHHVRKAIGAFAAVLGGLDTIVFSGGIGERSPIIRARIARTLEHLGIRIDDARNDAGAAIISTDASQTTVRVIATDEESIIAEETIRVLKERAS